MIKSIIGRAKTTKLMKKLAGGPQAILPLSPLKGSGVKGGGRQGLSQQKGYVVSKQNPAFTPNTGGLVRPRRMK